MQTAPTYFSFSEIIQERDASVKIIQNESLHNGNLSNGNMAFMKLIGKGLEHAITKTKLEMPRHEYIYAVHSEAFPSKIKIGRSRNIRKRLSNLNCSMPENPYKLYARFATYSASKDEAEAHSTFSQFHVLNEHYCVPLDQLSAYFQKKHAEHLEKRGAIKARVYVSRAFLSWKKKTNVPDRRQLAFLNQPSKSMADLNDRKRKREPDEESDNDQDLNTSTECHNKEINELDFLDIHAIKTCNRMRMDLMVRGMKIMNDLNSQWKEEDPDLVQEIHHKIASLVMCKCEPNHEFLQFSLQVQTMMLKNNEDELETVTQAIKLMKSLETETNPDWKTCHPDIVNRMKSTLIYSVMGISYPQLSCPLP